MPTVENQQSYFTSRYFYMQATYLFCIIQEAPIDINGEIIAYNKKIEI